MHHSFGKKYFAYRWRSRKPCITFSGVFFARNCPSLLNFKKASQSVLPKVTWTMQTKWYYKNPPHLCINKENDPKEQNKAKVFSWNKSKGAKHVSCASRIWKKQKTSWRLGERFLYGNSVSFIAFLYLLYFYLFICGLIYFFLMYYIIVQYH